MVAHMYTVRVDSSVQACSAVILTGRPHTTLPHSPLVILTSLGVHVVIVGRVRVRVSKLLLVLPVHLSLHRYSTLARTHTQCHTHTHTHTHTPWHIHTHTHTHTHTHRTRRLRVICKSAPNIVSVRLILCRFKIGIGSSCTVLVYNGLC